MSRGLRVDRSTCRTRSTRLAPVIFVMLFVAGVATAQPAHALDQTEDTRNETTEERLAIPTNLLATPILRSVIATMWHQSPTFKSQCARLRQAPSLVVEIRFGTASQLGTGRGRTDFIRSSHDATRADIYIDMQLRSVDQLAELIAHELEHVIEQLDDVELRPADRHGVYLTAGGTSETVRSIHVGQTVSREVCGATYRGQTLRRR